MHAWGPRSFYITPQPNVINLFRELIENKESGPFVQSVRCIEHLPVRAWDQGAGHSRVIVVKAQPVEPDRRGLGPHFAFYKLCDTKHVDLLSLSSLAQTVGMTASPS